MIPTNRRVMACVLAALACGALVLAGCTKVITAPSGAAANTVTAAGTGTVPGSPDEAEMSFGVTKTSSDAKTALSEASKVAEQITAAVKKTGVADKDIQTQNVSVYPQYSDQNGKQVVTGYQASIAVRVKVRDITKLGDVITAANIAGADTISGPSFSISETAPYRALAIDKAVADARKSAEAMAKAAGKSLGAVISVSSNDVVSQPGPMMYDSALAGSAKSVPIQAGQLDVTANVTVIFELK